MRKNTNTAHIEGRLYQHNLTLKTVQNQTSPNFGKPFISGEIEIAVDEEGLNVIPVHFTYVTETTKSGAKSPTFDVLRRIIDDSPTWVEQGKDAALKLKVDTALALNDFYANDDTLVSAKRNEGGFVSVVNALCAEAQRNTFTTDIVITKINHVDADPDKGTTDYTSVHGAVFDFRNAILPVDFVVENPAGMQYFESLDIDNSEPLYTRVWGRIKCETIVTETTVESAFGEPAVTTRERKSRSWVITGTAAEPYEFGEENTITTEELTKAIQDRQVYLADVKKRSDEYKASKNAPTTSAPATAAPAKAGKFKF